MIDGSIFQSIFWFSIPLLIGNFFQQLYNTVDSYVVGNFGGGGGFDPGHQYAGGVLHGPVHRRGSGDFPILRGQTG